MIITFYQAECGDAASIKYFGTDGLFHNIFIDAGYERTFRSTLFSEIESLASKNERIDLWVISHIHDDHIGGSIKYISAVEDGEIADIVNCWHYNQPRFALKNNKTFSISSPSSISQGDTLGLYLLKNVKLSIGDITNEFQPIDLFGLKLTILSPDILSLRALRAKYPLNSKNAYEKIEGEDISRPTAGVQNDYNKLVASFDFKNWQEDTSIENASSIALLTEFNNKSVLWLADSTPSVICSSLQNLGYSVANPIICDLVKVAHHGSKGNNSQELYAMIRCNDYFFSANGENLHCLPTKECLVNILLNPARPKPTHYKFYFPYDNSTLRNIFKVDGEHIFEELNFEMIFDKRTF